MYSVKVSIWYSFMLIVLTMACTSTKQLDEEVKLPLSYSLSPIAMDSTKAKFSRDIAYDSFSNTSFDIFLPQSETTTSIVIFIHGGGFTGGYKEQAYERYESQINKFLEKNIAFATINYRLMHESEDGVMTSLLDSKRCLQFIKYYASSFNINKNKIACFGTSAGAGTALWLGLSDDMRSMDSEDPILHESTKFAAIGAIATQATYDILRWEEVFKDYDLSMDNLPPFLMNRLTEFYGVDSKDALESTEVENYRNKVDMLKLMDSNDPPIWVKNEQKDVPPLFDLQHHPAHAKLVKEYADKNGLSNIVYAPALGIEDETGEGLIDFFDRILSNSNL